MLSVELVDIWVPDAWLPSVELVEKRALDNFLALIFLIWKPWFLTQKNASSVWNSFKYEFLTTVWVQKSFFGILYLDTSSAWKLWNFEWG